MEMGGKGYWKDGDGKGTEGVVGHETEQNNGGRNVR
jgi:hypothetical protein